MTLQKITADLSQLPKSFDNRPAARVETGPLEINGDWPGVFIRGDNAMNYAMYLNMAVENLKNQMTADNKIDVVTAHILEDLANLLASSRVG